MGFIGQIDATSTCTLAHFEGIVRGLPPVTRFWAKGNLLAPAVLYDRDGNVLGTEHPQLVTENNIPHYTDCTTPEGFTGGCPGTSAPSSNCSTDPGRWRSAAIGG